MAKPERSKKWQKKVEERQTALRKIAARLAKKGGYTWKDYSISEACEVVSAKLEKKGISVGAPTLVSASSLNGNVPVAAVEALVEVVAAMRGGHKPDPACLGMEQRRKWMLSEDLLLAEPPVSTPSDSALSTTVASKSGSTQAIMVTIGKAECLVDTGHVVIEIDRKECRIKRDEETISVGRGAAATPFEVYDKLSGALVKCEATN